jgi:hypothetical protein
MATPLGGADLADVCPTNSFLSPSIIQQFPDWTSLPDRALLSAQVAAESGG